MSAQSSHQHGSTNGAHACNPPAPPPAWPRTAEPLRIAILGWARLSAQAWEGSGYNLSASELARGLVMSGHEVFYLASGMTYRLFRGPHIAPRETWNGIPCYDLRNSPNLSPSASNFNNIGTEIACPRQARLVVKWLDQVGAQIVHIHSLEGYGLDLIPAIRASGRPVVVTPHNYWYLCPQVDLLHQEVRVCMDYQGGSRCVGCLPALQPAQAKRKRAHVQTLESWLGPYPADVLRKAFYGVRPLLRSLLRARLHRRWVSEPPNPEHAADPELALGFDLPETPARPSDGLIRHGYHLTPSEHARTLEPSAPDQNEQFLKADHHLAVVNEYGRRRVAGIGALNHASLVTPPSDFLRKVHVAMGLAESRTRLVRLGQPHFDQINRCTRRSPFYDTPPWRPDDADRPLRLAFLGTTRNNKGVEVLLQAIPLLERHVRQRCHFIVRALGWDWPFRKRMSLYPEVSFAGGYDLLQLISMTGEYDVGLLPHIWFENSPLVMLEHLHAGKFVIASRLGGPPDWIRPPLNGLLFPAGRPDALAACITQLVTGQVRLPSPRQVHAASVLQSYPAHVRDVEGIYRELLGKAPADPAPPAEVQHQASALDGDGAPTINGDIVVPASRSDSRRAASS